MFANHAHPSFCQNLMCSCLLSDRTHRRLSCLEASLESRLLGTKRGCCCDFSFQESNCFGILMQRHMSATVQGLNPKFMATKEQVARLIGDRKDVFESELRRSMGNNPDTSKALRCVSLAQHHLLTHCIHKSSCQCICMACMVKAFAFKI